MDTYSSKRRGGGQLGIYNINKQELIALKRQYFIANKQNVPRGNAFWSFCGGRGWSHLVIKVQLPTFVPLTTVESPRS